MALDRTNMVSLLDVGHLFGGKTETLVEMGDGYTELTEDWGPNVETKQYVNMKAKASVVSGYEFSISPEREYMSDDLQKEIDKLFKKFPTGADCETYYCRFYKTDAVSGSSGVFEAIRIPVTIAPSGTGGEGGGTLTSSIQINGNGEVQEGYITFSNGEYIWSESAG